MRVISILILAILSGCRSDDVLVIVFGGDVMLDRGIRQQIQVKGVDYFTSDIKQVFDDADYSVINLECPATHEGAPIAKKFMFRADPEWLPQLSSAGITHSILANNHSYDQGRTGLISTADHLNSSKITPIGYGETQKLACEPVLIRKHEIDVAIFSSVTLGLEGWMYLEDEPGMCQATIGNLKESISNYKLRHPTSFIIVTLHWGIEYQLFPTDAQQRQAAELVRAGADAIVGHHPHVIQSFELIDGKPVFYSIGNLIFDNPHPLAAEGILVRFSIMKNNSQTKIIPYRIINGKPFLMDEKEKLNLFPRLDRISNELKLVW